MDAFEFLLEDLSKELGCELKVDAHHTCKIRMKEKLDVQIELDRSFQHLIIGIFLGALPAGKYREQILKEALLSNGELPPKPGKFAYSERKSGLVLFEQRRVQDLDGSKIHTLLNELYEKALPWQEAISKGDIPVIQRTNAPQESASIFKIKF